MNNLLNGVEGKTALITGGVSGIGLGIAKVFAKAGANIALGYRNEAHLQEAMAWFAQRPEIKVKPIKLDVTSEENWVVALKETEEEFGKLHILCNNAGATFVGSVLDATMADWEWIMNINLWGVLHGTKTCVPAIKRHGEGGHIINVTSMAGYLGGAEVGLYSVSKYAARGLTQALRSTLAEDNIGVSEVAPGLTNSNIHHSLEKRAASPGDSSLTLNDKMIEQFGNMMEQGMNPEEVGQKVLDGIIKNSPVIFTHPEFRDEMRELCEELVDAFPDEEVPAQRMAIEADRRAGKESGGGLVNK